jgi:hypothetical protein
MRIIPALLCLSLATLAWPQSKPDFSGSWNLNLADSDYSAPGVSRPDRLVRTIQQKGDHLKYQVVREKDGQKGGFEVDLVIGGGSPFVSDEAGIVEAKWKGQALEIDTLYNPGSDRESSQTENWTLASDGKRLIDQLVVHRHDGSEVRIKRVFDKTEAK